MVQAQFEVPADVDELIRLLNRTFINLITVEPNGDLLDIVEGDQTMIRQATRDELMGYLHGCYYFYFRGMREPEVLDVLSKLHDVKDPDEQMPMIEKALGGRRFVPCW